MVSTRPPISKSSNPFINPYVTVPSAPITDGITVTFMFSIIIIIIILLLWEFFTPTLADGFSLDFEWQQVPSSLLDSSQYSGRS